MLRVRLFRTNRPCTGRRGKMKDFFVTVYCIIVIALAMLIFLFSAANAQQPGVPKRNAQGEALVDRGGEEYGKGMWTVFSRLDLTAEQKSGIKSILSDQDMKLQPLMSAFKNNRDMLRSLSADGTFNEAEVRGIATRQAAILTELIVARHRAKARLYALLTVDQRTRAERMLDSLNSADDLFAD